MSERLEDLPTEVVAGPTVMEQAHANGVRKAITRLKPHLNDRGEAEDALRVAMLTYLTEWAAMYAQGVREVVAPTDRVILQIRQDTVGQMAAELGKTTRVIVPE